MSEPRSLAFVRKIEFKGLNKILLLYKYISQHEERVVRYHCHHYDHNIIKDLVLVTHSNLIKSQSSYLKNLSFVSSIS